MDRSTRQQQSNKNANFPKQVPAMSSNDCGDNALENQMENVLQLMTKRARGDQSVSNDQVEKAVSDILTSSMGASAQPPPPRQLPDESPEIQVDTGNYDDDDVDDEDYEEEADRKKKPTRQVTKAKQKEALKKQKKEKKKIEEAYKDAISQIPLGKEGAKMMTTFGDGTKPIPRAMQAALLGTRKSLQVAIMDARAIRRRAKKTFEDARQSFVQRNKSSQSDAVDPNILYRALSGHDRLTYQPKCGFDMEQLTWLFPEEMRAYQRWTNLRTEAQTDGADDLSNDGEVHASVASEEKDKKDLDSEENKEPVGGHLRERAAHFDVRTDQMKSEWYLEFSTKVRQGTFLARGKSRRSKADREWEEDRKAKRGRRETGVWETMSAQSVRFLHWLGFDPPAIHPPNEETTQALAFLAYDILGRIIEKAIFLRNIETMEKKGEVDETNMVWELKQGEQLTPEDIERSMADPDIRPASLLHGADESSHPSFQLYFGPGFEERLELEMDELIASAEKTAKLSEEERTIRQNEAELLEKISKPPMVIDSLKLLMQKSEEEEEEVQPSEQTAKRTRLDPSNSKA